MISKQSLRGINSRVTNHRPLRRKILKTLLLFVFMMCLSVVIFAHLHVAKKMKASDGANTSLERDTSAARAPNKPGSNNKEEKQQHSPQHYIIFSTTCSEQQDWESYVFFYHALKVNQPGNVTRLASGCSEEEAKKLSEFHATHIESMSNRFHLHLTPDYSRVRLDKGKFGYKYMNKPFSVRHWMENVLGLNESRPVPADIESDVVILMDPDMILLRPLTGDFTKDYVIWAKEPENESFMKVANGKPMCQQDGYLTSEWLKFNMTYITQDANTPALLVKPQQAPVHYNSGPPYLATVRDMYSIAIRWTEFAPRVYDVYPKLFAEMFGQITAAAHLKLPHTMIKSIVVSTTKTLREGWPMIDALPDDRVCNPPSDANMPFVLHYCKRYFLGRFFFSKYRLRKNYLSCETPLLTIPSNDILDVDYFVRIPEASGKQNKNVTKEAMPDRKIRKRELFMLCALIGKINEAVVYFKRNHCGGDANFNETYNFHDYPYKN